MHIYKHLRIRLGDKVGWVGNTILNAVNHWPDLIHALILPCSWNERSSDVQTEAKLKKQGSGKSISKYICILKFGQNMKHTNLTGSNIIANNQSLCVLYADAEPDLRT